MDETHVIKPNRKFVEEIIGRGGDSLKQCFQCSTCTVMCPIAPHDNPFPRKEMIWAQWGLKDRLMTDPDIWICQRCEDCSTNCPRDAKPGTVLAAIREKVIGEYAFPGFLAKAFSSPRYLPLILLIPVGLVVLWLWIWGDLHYPNTFSANGEIVLSDFIESVHGDYGLAIMFAFVFGVLAFGIRRFWKGLMTSEASHNRSGLTIRQSLILAVIQIFKHSNFKKCQSSKKVYYAHLSIFYGLLFLLAATGVTFLFHYAFGWHSPWGVFSPTKAFGIIGSALVMVGLSIAVYRRLADPNADKSSYGDWLLLWLIIFAVLTGLATWLIRVTEWEAATYWAYLIHIVAFFELFIFAPYSKGAHIFYRLTAMTWSNYTGRGL
ncbi:MAG: quinone-interacting membrane-bound oxidoreductase complex subunit QmoC [Dehalococcoidia bacterium]